MSAKRTAYSIRITREHRALTPHCLQSGEVFLNLPTEASFDLSRLSDRDALREAVFSALPSIPKSAEWDLGQMLMFATIRPGDLIVLQYRGPNHAASAIGEVVQPYAFRSHALPHLRHVIVVKWRLMHIAQSCYLHDFQRSFSSPRQVIRLEAPPHAVVRLLEMIRIGGSQPRDPGYLPKGAVESSGGAANTVASPSPCHSLAEAAILQVLEHIRQEFGPHQLPELVGEVLKAYGWEISVAKPGPDGGVDIHGVRGGESLRVAVRARRVCFTNTEAMQWIKGGANRPIPVRSLLVSLEGFSRRITWKMQHETFALGCLWSGIDLVKHIFAVYDRFPMRIKMRIPLEQGFFLLYPEETKK